MARPRVPPRRALAPTHPPPTPPSSVRCICPRTSILASLTFARDPLQLDPTVWEEFPDCFEADERARAGDAELMHVVSGRTVRLKKYICMGT